MMFETKLSLTVPLDTKVRDDIRKKVEQFFAARKIVPPVSYDALTQWADALISHHGWQKGHKAFVMVCCGNAIWRSIVGAVPYHRRMLMLPQCLRNSHLCKASHDELGLLCSECGNCEIGDFLHEAEALGYVTSVTEGTTIATKLVESGKVDAIIGVGCMEVLQKIFAAVHKYSVPAIGVPLLNCGCVNTKADADWIREEINYVNREPGLRIMNLNQLRDETNALFTADLVTDLLQLSGSPTDQLVLETLLAGGKRIRPLLTLLTYEAFSSQSDPRVREHLALSVECFHKASLIHDDIEDDDSLRYGKATLHARYGAPVAINLGDLLIGEGYRLIAECRLTPLLIRECMKIISRGHKALSLGQGKELMARVSQDILSLRDVLVIFENKTAAAFRASLLLGAVAGGAGKRMLDLLDTFSHLMGIAYQLQDDMEDFSRDDESSSFENPSVLLAMLAEKVNEKDRPIMKKAFSEINLSALHLLIDKYRVRDAVTLLIKEHLDKIEDCLKGMENIGLKLALHEIVGKTFSNYL